MSIGSFIGSFWRVIVWGIFVLLIAFSRLVAQEIVIELLGKAFWDRILNNMEFVIITVISIGFALYQRDKTMLLKKQLDGFSHPIPDITIRETAAYIQKEKKSWRKYDEQKICTFILSSVVANGDMTAWGSNKVYGSGRVQNPSLLTPDFFREWSGHPEGESDFWINSLRLNKWHHNIYLNKKQLRKAIKDLPKAMPPIFESIEPTNW